MNPPPIPTPMRLPRFVAAALLTAFITHPAANAATSVTRHGVTWHFAEDRPTGQFANGDWWVAGPVTITRITPETVNDQSGTMINPGLGADNGWDNRIKYGKYSATLNIAKSLPRTVPAGSSVVTATSFATQSTADNPQLESLNVLTVLAAPAPAGAFRPPWLGTDKTLAWNVSQLNYGALRRLPKPANTPALATVEGYFARPWIEKTTGWTGRYFHPFLNHPFQNRGTVGTYGREMAHTAADGLLSLQLDYTNAEKTTLLIRLVQAGLDIHGAARLGGYWGDGGGHNQGRKMVLLLAGTVLNDPAILAYCDAGKRMIFQEDLQTFYVTQADIDRVHIGVNNTSVEEYTAADLGMPEWGTNHKDQPQYDNRKWSTLYRIVAGPCTLGHVLTARLMGLESRWNHPACFDYYDRFHSIEQGNVSTGTNSIQPFVSSMWRTYRSGSGGALPPPTTIFRPGDRIAVTRNTNVRASGALGATLLGVQTNGSTGTLVQGPVTADGIAWWQVDYDTGTDGWSGADNFTTTTKPAPKAPPSPPRGLRVLEN